MHGENLKLNCLHYVSLQVFILSSATSPFTFTPDTKWFVYTHMQKNKQLSLTMT